MDSKYDDNASSITHLSRVIKTLQQHKNRNSQMRSRRSVFVLAVAIFTAGCASPQPVLYPNVYYNTVGSEVAERDIAECKELADAAGASPADDKATKAAKGTATGAAVGAASGAVGGAIRGSAGAGAAIGAASGATFGLLGSLFRTPKPSAAYVNFVNRCLRERGYEPVGWK